jgi:hypothetical protein
MTNREVATDRLVWLLGATRIAAVSELGKTHIEVQCHSMSNMQELQALLAQLRDGIDEPVSPSTDLGDDAETIGGTQ